MEELISIENEKRMLIKGATKVISSLPNQCVIQTTLSTIVISGSNIEVKKLDIENTEIALEGSFNNIKFSQKGEKQPFFKRIFK